jgi:hypothetical protein
VEILLALEPREREKVLGLSVMLCDHKVKDFRCFDISNLSFAQMEHQVRRALCQPFVELDWELQ